MIEEIFVEYNNILNIKNPISTKIEKILSDFSINNNLPIFYIGILNDFIVKEPQYYYNQNVKNEIINNLNTLYSEDEEKFLDVFLTNIDKFFYSLNSYYNILDLYNELDDIGLDRNTKVKIYDLPLITQLMEYCLNHFYKGIASIEGVFKNKDYSTQNTLGKLKNILISKYPNLLNIDIDFRDALSHGSVDIRDDKIEYSYTERGTRNLIFKEIEYYQIESKKNELLDIASGAILGLILFMTEKEILTDSYLSSLDEKMTFEFFKLLLHNENIKIKSYSKGTIGSSQFNIHIKTQHINDKNSLIHILILIAKITLITFPNYERYFINYEHPYSIGGMISFTKQQLEQILYACNTNEINRIIENGESVLLIPDIQDISQDNRAYKFHTFPKLYGKNWETALIKDISTDKIKRFEARLIIKEKNILKKEIESLIFQVTKKIRLLENKANPTTKIKHGKMEADIVRLNIFYKPHRRNGFSLRKNNENFICLVHFYKSKSIPKIKIPFQDNYIFEKIKKLDIYWNKNYEHL